MVINDIRLREHKPPAEVPGLLFVPNSGYLACLDISPCLAFLFLLAFQGLFVLSFWCGFSMWDEARVSWDNLPLRLPPLLPFLYLKGRFASS